MAGSIIVAVRSALIDGLNALPAFDGVEVAYQWVGGSSERERVFTRRARFTHTSASMRAGRNFRDEVGRFELVVFIEGVGQSAEWAGERALTLGLAVEEYVADRKNNELAISGLQTLVIEGEGQLDEMFNDAGHLAELSYPITYTARLT